MYKSNYSCLMYKTIYKYTSLKRIYRSLDGSEYIRKITIYLSHQEKYPSIFQRSSFLRAKPRPNQYFCADERMNDYGKRKKHCNEAMLSTWSF